MTSKQVKWNWSKECQKIFDTIKKLVSRETLPFYPNFNKPFATHMDTSKCQIRGVIRQKLMSYKKTRGKQNSINMSSKIPM